MKPPKHHPGQLATIALLLTLNVPGARADTCTVDHCHDGDTCTLICAGAEVKTRLHCIDAPEMGQGDWGKQSRDVLKNRLPPRSTVELQAKTKDRYGRTVGVLVHNGTNINLQMVHSGWAAAFPKYCAEPVYYQAQDDAKQNQRGIWKQAGQHQQPWEWRAARR